MKLLYRVAIIVLTVILVSTMIASIVYSQSIENIMRKQGLRFSGATKKPDAHFVVIVPDPEESFVQSIKKGVNTAREEFNVAVEMNSSRLIGDSSDFIRYLDIAIASRVDGIVIHVLDEGKFTPLINKAVHMGIPVVTIEVDAKDSKRQAFVGTNNYQLGYEGGKLMVEATGGKAQVAIILSSFSDNYNDVDQNLRVTGFRDAVRRYPDIEIATIKHSEMGILSAEEVTLEILNEFPDVNAIFCNSSKDTIGAAQVVVDFNKVGDITIIGHDDLPETLRYVEKQVVYGTIVRNPEKTGYQAIKALVELNLTNRTSSYVDTGVHVVTSKNLKEYQNIQ